MKTQAVKGMFDYLPCDAQLRDYIQAKILDVYTKQGFNRIYTPIVEDIENLEKSDGGENLNLIFKILKRGDKFQKALENGENLCDLGLRYDLTLPLSRFYADHKNNLILPFKVIQIDRVYRAERPQKGRNREFVQCDIDILGSNSIDCEIELIDTTSRVLLNLGLKDFVVKINNRSLLKKLLLSFGFEQTQLDSVCIVFDKMDKIGADGVRQELIGKNFAQESIEKLCSLITNLPISLEDLKQKLGSLQEIEDLQNIINASTLLSKGQYKIEFDISLVRGQGYYTGTVFEIKSNQFASSLAGGGRYDDLIGKFDGNSVPAVGFSIGFERIFSILKQQNLDIKQQKIAVIYEDGKIVEALDFSKSLQDKYTTSLFVRPKKLGKLLDKLQNDGFGGYIVIDESRQIKIFNKEV